MTNKDFNRILCARIKALRLSKDIKMEKLAYQSGISKGGLSEIEHMKKEPRIYTIFKICSALNITLKEFFDFREIDDFMELFK